MGRLSQQSRLRELQRKNYRRIERQGRRNTKPRRSRRTVCHQSTIGNQKKGYQTIYQNVDHILPLKLQLSEDSTTVNANFVGFDTVTNYFS